MRWTATIPTALALTVTACSVHKVDTTPTSPVVLPADYGDRPRGTPHTGPWWTSFSDPQLTHLIDSSLPGNLRMRAMWGRLEEARAIAGLSSAPLYPSVDAELGAGRGRDLTGSTGNSFSWSVAAGYELDIWKRVASARSAAELDVRAARDDLEASAITLSATVAETWYDVVHARSEAALLEQQLSANHTFLELVRFRFQQGLVSSLDIHQQRQRVAQVEARLAVTRARLETAEHRLAVLLGRAPRSTPIPSANQLPALPNFPSTGVPADLLDRRPDVRAARRRVVATDYRVASAIADRLPAIRLSASVGQQSSTVGDLFTTPIWNLAAGVFAPLFDGGRRAAEVDRQRAQLEQRVAEWGQTMLDAVREVDDAIALERHQLTNIDDTAAALDAARDALAEARDRYQQGLTDYLPVLTALTAVQELEISLLGARRQLVSYRIQLYRALGGSWTRTLTQGSKHS